MKVRHSALTVVSKYHFLQRNQTLLDKWLIPGLGKEMYKSLENTVIPENKEAFGGLSKKIQEEAPFQFPTGQSWDNFSISKDNIRKRLKLIMLYSMS